MNKKLTEKAQKVHGMIDGNPVDLDMELLKEVMHECPHCGKRLVPATDSVTGEVSGHIFRAGCGCLGKNFRVSFG